MCWGQRVPLPGCGVGPHPTPVLVLLLLPSGPGTCSSLSLVLVLGWLAGHGLPWDAAFHLQCLGPAFILIGVLTVLHMLWGQGSMKSQPQP